MQFMAYLVFIAIQDNASPIWAVHRWQQSASTSTTQPCILTNRANPILLIFDSHQPSNPLDIKNTIVCMARYMGYKCMYILNVFALTCIAIAQGIDSAKAQTMAVAKTHPKITGLWYKKRCLKEKRMPKRAKRTRSEPSNDRSVSQSNRLMKYQH